MTDLISFPGGVISVDIVSSLGLDLQANESEYATERGEPRSDTKIKGAPTITAEVMQSEHPISDPSYSTRPLDLVLERVKTRPRSPFLIVGSAIRTALGIVPEPFKFESLQTLTPKDRGGDLADTLTRLWSGNDLCEVSFRDRIYPGMSLIGVGLLQDGHALTKFSLRFQYRREASISYVQMANPEDVAMKPPKKLGKKDGADGSKGKEASATQQKSLLAMGFDAL